MRRLRRKVGVRTFFVGTCENAKSPSSTPQPNKSVLRHFVVSNPLALAKCGIIERQKRPAGVGLSISSLSRWMSGRLREGMMPQFYGRDAVLGFVGLEVDGWGEVLDWSRR